MCYFFFFTGPGQAGSSPNPAVGGLAKIFKELLKSRISLDSQICHLQGAGLKRNADTNWGSGDLPSFFPVPAAWPNKGALSSLAQ